MQDDKHQHVQAAHNFGLKPSSREDSLCRHAVDSDNEVVVPDTCLDTRFSSHPLITGLPNRQCRIRDLQVLAMAASGDSAPRRLVLIDCIDMPRAYELARSMGMELVESLLRDMATLLPLRLRPATGEPLYTVATGRFAVLTGDDSHMNAEWVARWLEGGSADLGDGIAVALSTYAGEVTFTTGSITAQEALRRAVSALHEAIGRGGGRHALQRSKPRASYSGLYADERPRRRVTGRQKPVARLPA